MTLSKSATRPGTPRSAAAGFSMIELVVSLSVMLILTALAVPSLMRSLRTYQLNSAAARVSDMMKYTRFEAVRQNKKMSFLRSEEHTSELQSPDHLVCRLLLEKKKQKKQVN